MNKSCIALGAAVAELGIIMWARKRYLEKNTRTDFNAAGLLTKDTIIQDAVLEEKLNTKPKILISKTAENFEVKRKTQPLLLLNEIFACINYRVTVIQNPPPVILVECVIAGEKFSAQAPSKKAAQRIIAIKALDFFFGRIDGNNFNKYYTFL